MADEKKKEEQKPMKLPRFSYQVPEDLTSDFLQEMADDTRETPSDLITAILRKHFKRQKEERMLKAFSAQPVERREIPHYGPKPSTSEAGQEESRSADAG